MNISILASIWCQNLWDELILKNEIKIFEQIYKWDRLNFRVFSYDYKNPFFEKENIEYLEYFPIWIRNTKNILKNILNFKNFIKTTIWSDLIIIWWGWIIYDNEVQLNRNPLDQFIFRNNIFRFFRKKVIFYAIWINIKKEENLWKLKQIFKSVSKIYVRDNFSNSQLELIWLKSEIIDDPVFFDDIKEPEIKWEKPFLELKQKNLLIKIIDSHNFKMQDLENINFENKNIWITFRAWYIWKSGNEKIEILMIREVINYLLKKNAKVFLLPHSINLNDTKSNDLEFYNKIVFLNLDNKVYIAKNIQEVYEIYKFKNIDLCLSMRLHSMILSNIYNIPFVAFSYSKKTDELIKKIK